LGKDQLSADEIIEESKDIEKEFSGTLTKNKEGSFIGSPVLGAGLKSAKILVVDDNMDVRTYLSGLLYNEYEIEEASDGEEGLVAARRINPDLIISDVMMPKIDGMSFCRELKNDLEISHIPVILLTARADQEDKLRGLETGADDYIAKPFEAKELCLKVKNIIDQHRRMRQKFRQEYFLNPQEITVSAIDQKFLSNLISTIENEIQNPEFKTDQLAASLHVSRPTLNRKIKVLTDMSPSAFIRVLRLNKAKQLLQNGFGNITEVAFEVGFSSSSHFTRSYKSQYGQSPTEDMKS
jgi:DNA-binding response OmpR family regulator